VPGGVGSVNGHRNQKALCKIKTGATTYRLRWMVRMFASAGKFAAAIAAAAGLRISLMTTTHAATKYPVS